jgi:hypothetical protein
MNRLERATDHRWWPFLPDHHYERTNVIRIAKRVHPLYPVARATEICAHPSMPPLPVRGVN